MTRARWALLAAGGLLVLAAVLVLVWPLRANGLSGSALNPHYREFGFTSYLPLPERPTHAQLRAAGLVLPQDVVERHRHWAELLAAVGAALLLTVLISLRRPRPHARQGYDAMASTPVEPGGSKASTCASAEVDRERQRSRTLSRRNRPRNSR